MRESNQYQLSRTFKGKVCFFQARQAGILSSGSAPCSVFNLKVQLMSALSRKAAAVRERPVPWPPQAPSSNPALLPAACRHLADGLAQTAAAAAQGYGRSQSVWPAGPSSVQLQGALQ